LSSFICAENSTTTKGPYDGTSIALSLLQLYYNNPPSRQLTMIPMSSRRRAAVEFPIQCSLFVNQKVNYSITGMTKYYIKSVSATMLGKRRQTHGFHKLSILFYENRGMAVCASNIKIPAGWTPKLFLGLLLQEWCITNVISLFPVKDQACDDIFKMWLHYYNCSSTQLMELVLSSPNYSFVTGGF
jgi:hypothetical protein